MSTLLIERRLIEPGRVPGEPSRVAAATYAEDPDTKSPGGPAYSYIDTANGRRLCVEIDSIQAQRNRAQSTIRRLRDDGKITLPKLSVQFANGTMIDVLEMSHGIADATLRHSTFWDQHEFAPSSRREIRDDVTFLLQWAPLTLVCGAWDSMRVPNWRLPRSLEARVTGYGPARPMEHFSKENNRITRGAQKVDRLFNAKKAKIQGAIKNGVIQGAIKNGVMTDVAKAASKPTKKERFSTVGLGDIPAGCKPSNQFELDTIEQRAIFSLSEIERYRFPLDGKYDPDRDIAGRRMVRALGDLMIAALFEEPISYRVGCRLVPILGSQRSIRYDSNGESTPYTMPDLSTAISEWKSAVDDGEKHGLSFFDEIAHASPSLEKAFAICDKDLVGSDDKDD